MLWRTTNASITEWPIPIEKGLFTLNLSSQYKVLSIQEQEPGKPVLLIQEESTSRADASFELVETKQVFEADDEHEYLGSIKPGGNLLHLLGVRQPRNQGGAC